MNSGRKATPVLDQVITLEDDSDGKGEIMDDDLEDGEIPSASEDEKDIIVPTIPLEEEISSNDDDVVVIEETTKETSTKKLVKTKKRMAKGKTGKPKNDELDTFAETNTEYVETPKTSKAKLTSKKKTKDNEYAIETDAQVYEQYSSFIVDRADDEKIAGGTKKEAGQTGSTWRDDIMDGLLSSAPSNGTGDGPKSNRKRPMVTCWNCDGDHNLNQCPEKKDQKKIRLARATFEDNKRKSDLKERYHGSQAELAETGNNFRAGRISDELRKALGLGRDDLPEYIYRMRKMGFTRGYPPGYLKRAIIKTTEIEGLTFLTDRPLIKSENAQRRKKEDPKAPVVEERKIIYFMGFNNSYRFMKDRESNFRVPPFEVFVQMLQKEQDRIYKEKMANEAKKSDNQSTDVEDDDDEDMVVDSGDEVGYYDEAPEDGEVNDFSITNESSNQTSLQESFEIDRQPAVAEIPDTPKSVQGVLSSSSIGTPMLSDPSETDGEAVSMPALSTFSVGITPFKMEEDQSQRKGLFKKMLTSLQKKCFGKQ